MFNDRKKIVRNLFYVERQTKEEILSQFLCSEPEFEEWTKKLDKDQKLILKLFKKKEYELKEYVYDKNKVKLKVLKK